MREKILPGKIKKNLLDMHYHKNLQYFNTSIIICFTYIIGMSIAFITKQIGYRHIRHTTLVAIISIAFLSFIVALLLKFKEHLDEIPKEIKKLNLN